MPRSHFFVLQRKSVQAGVQNCNGLPSVCGCCQLGDGGCRRESLGELPSTPRFWKCYVDDTFTAFPKTLITSFLDHLNGIEPSITFTVEEERDRQLAFLDVLLCTEDDSTICTSVYCKATHTNQYLFFKSYHLTARKVAVVRTLMTRAENLSSLGVDQTEEEKYVTDALRGNEYPLASSRSTPSPAEGVRKWRLRDQRQPSHYPILGGNLMQSDVS